uniref:Lipocalin/cytosolic fatty-acid binding domain-containing protein n=1 Tax=Haptolina brevifila TaxID=156173 RepID=A0A7S2BPZ0_9EUKA|mmetsp:Transcript_15346/g.30800  ORF Transcript_15346/g.30800 Transcript_15346/m.30800 type:complete len:197 (+) Transcript_15346:81-671(+)
MRSLPNSGIRAYIPLVLTFLNFFHVAEARLLCPEYESIATDAARNLDPSRYQGFWFEVFSHNVFLVDSCQCTRYNFSLSSPTTFTDDFTCHKGRPDAPLFLVHNKGSFRADEPGKMVESLGPASPPYWVLHYWGDYEYALVYACVGSPLLGEYTYFFSRNASIPAAQYAEMTSFALERNISLRSVKPVPMAGCTWS